MVKPFANPKGKKSRVEVLPNRFTRDTITGGGPVSRANNWHGKTGSPHKVMDEMMTQGNDGAAGGAQGSDADSPFG